MNKLLALIVACAAAAPAAWRADEPRRHPAEQPVPIIFDTDVGNDIDDVLTLAMLHALESLGECKLLAVTITKDNRHAAPFVDALNTFYGRGGIPIGMVRGGFAPEDGRFLRAITDARDGGALRYPRKLQDGGDAPEAVALLRRVLARQADGAVVIVQVGFSTNLARLLDSKPDAASPLDGLGLVAKKVRLLSAMAGRFAADGKRFPEYNVKVDVKSARRLFARWPTPIVFSGYEIGQAILFPAASIDRDFGYAAHHPVAEAYRAFAKMPYDRPTWDLTSALYAVRPEAGYFGLSPAGRVIVENDGTTRFQPAADGPHRHLTATPAQAARALRAFQELCGRPPGGQIFGDIRGHH